MLDKETEDLMVLRAEDVTITFTDRVQQEIHRGMAAGENAAQIAGRIRRLYAAGETETVTVHRGGNADGER